MQKYIRTFCFVLKKRKCGLSLGYSSTNGDKMVTRWGSNRTSFKKYDYLKQLVTRILAVAVCVACSCLITYLRSFEKVRCCDNRNFVEESFEDYKDVASKKRQDRVSSAKEKSEPIAQKPGPYLQVCYALKNRVI